jgi:hypothetical protein
MVIVGCHVGICGRVIARESPRLSRSRHLFGHPTLSDGDSCRATPGYRTAIGITCVGDDTSAW